MHKQTTKICVDCGLAYRTASNRRVCCDLCRLKRRNQYESAYHAKRYADPVNHARIREQQAAYRAANREQINKRQNYVHQMKASIARELAECSDVMLSDKPKPRPKSTHVPADRSITSIEEIMRRAKAAGYGVHYGQYIADLREGKIR